MRVLVIGGTGYIGSHTVEELLRRNYTVSVFARGRKVANLPETVSIIKGDRHNPQDLEKLCALRFDAVIDISACTREETQAVINLFDGRIHRFVHVSTAKVCQRVTGIPLGEDDPLIIDPGAGYAYEKAECERALRWAYAKSRFPFVSLRPVAVFGPRDHLSRENYYLKRLVAGDPVIVPDSGSTPIYAVYVKDLAKVIANALTAEGAIGSAFHLMQREIVSINDHIKNIGQIAGTEVDIAHIPSRLLERLGFNLAHFPYFSGDAIIICDTRMAETHLGFAPTPYRTALKQTVEYFLQRGPETEPSIEDSAPPLIPRWRERLLVDRYRTRARELEDRLTDEWLNEALPKA
jgi:2'-hydroxyisoflavone reductase